MPTSWTLSLSLSLCVPWYVSDTGVSDMSEALTNKQPGVTWGHNRQSSQQSLQASDVTEQHLVIESLPP